MQGERFAVGHDQRTGDGWLTGTTVVLCPPGTVGGVDQRGGAPGTRETDLLDPRNLVDQVDAIVLSGGSAYGLAAATGAVDWLEEQGRGWPIPVRGGALRSGSPQSGVVPIVPAAVVFDLGRGGDLRCRPDAAFGRRACEAARPVDAATPPARGTVGAGTGTSVGGLKGGVGWATLTAGDVTVAALAVLNAAGSAVDPATGRPYADLHHTVPAPDPAALATGLGALPASYPPPLNTTLAVVLTDAQLTKAQAQKVAGVGQDGLARAVRPSHTMVDGDTVFTLASGAVPVGDLFAYDRVLAAAADAVTLACLDALLSAVSTPGLRAYGDLFPATAGTVVADVTTRGRGTP